MSTEHEARDAAEASTTEAQKIRSDGLVEPAGSTVDEHVVPESDAEKIEADGLEGARTADVHTSEAVRVRSDRLHEHGASPEDVDVTTEAEKIRSDDLH